MGYIGNEIVQTRSYQDPKAAEPKLNYKHAFPITVFDAVRDSMDDENSQTLREALDHIQEELQKRQMVVPALPTNFLVTYAGVAGEVGSVEISHKIPWDPSARKHTRIPTEKAVGDLLQSIGILDSGGKPIQPETQIVRWSDIIGRPQIYNSFGDNDDGVITQDVITAALAELRRDIAAAKKELAESAQGTQDDLNDHRNDRDNPHGITREQIGAASDTDLQHHLAAENPHGITAETLGLGNVDNTSDEDKPLSTATREEIAKLEKLIRSLDEKIPDTDGDPIVSIDYNRLSGKLIAEHRSHSQVVMNIPINGLIDDIRYDVKRKSLIIYELSGTRRDVSLAKLVTNVIGSKGTSIEVELIPSDDGKDQVIRANILPGSITAEMLSPDIQLGGGGPVDLSNILITTKNLKDGCVTTEKIRDRNVTSQKIAPRAVDGKALFSADDDNQVLITRKAGADPVWGRIISNLIADRAILTAHLQDSAVTTRTISDKAVTTEKLEDGSVTGEKIHDGTISGSKMVHNVHLPGTPSSTQSPNQDAEGHELTDASWVRNYVSEYKITENNLNDQTIVPKKIISSKDSHAILATMAAGTNPVWTKIVEKLIADDAITSRTIQESAVGSKQLFTSDYAWRILAAVEENGHPVFTRIVREMLDENLIGTRQIEDQAVTLNKLTRASDNYQILGSRLKGSVPEWTKITSNFIDDHAILARHMFTPDEPNLVMIFEQIGGSPEWSKIKQGMIAENAVTGANIAPKSILASHLADDIINTMNVRDRSITTEKIAYRAITGQELFTSAFPDRVLAVPGRPYEHPQWVKVTGAMMEDGAVTTDKLTSSTQAFTLIGVRKPGDRPEYLKLTRQFFDAVLWGSMDLEPNLMLRGTPSLAQSPRDNANNHQIVDAAWVRRQIQVAVAELRKEIPNKDDLTSCDCGDLTEDKVDEIWGDILPDPPKPPTPDTPPACTCEMEELGSDPVREMWDGSFVYHPSDSGGPYPDCDLEEVGATDVAAIWNGTHPSIPDTDPEACACGLYPLIETEVEDIWNDRYVQKPVTPGGSCGCDPTTPPVSSKPGCGCDDLEEVKDQTVMDLWNGTYEGSDEAGEGDNECDCGCDPMAEVSDAAVKDLWDNAKKGYPEPSDPYYGGLGEHLVLLGHPTLNKRPPAGASDAAGIGSMVPDCQWVLDRIKEELKNIAANGSCGCNCSGSVFGGYWIELSPETVIFEWDDFASGDLEADPSELTDEQIRAEWESGAVDDLEASDAEISDERIRALWNDPGMDIGADLSGLWTEISPDQINQAYDENGSGSIDSNDGELSMESLKEVWDTNGAGSTDHDQREISKETVDSEWAGIPTSELEYDATPHPFPGEEESSNTCNGCCSCGIGSMELQPGSVKNEHLADGSVSPNKLFTTMEPGTVLSVLESGEAPQYTKIIGPMIKDGTISTNKITGAEFGHAFLMTENPGEDPKWVSFSRDFLGTGIIGTDQIEDESITTSKMAKGSISFDRINLDTINIDNLLREHIIHTQHIADASVTNEKLAPGCIDNSKIADGTIGSEKFQEDIILPAGITVAPVREYEKRSLRNIIISPNAPANARNGDIWFRYY